jgi:hypothetical protein
MVAEADEKLMEAFFAEGTLTQEQLVSGTRSASSRCSTPSPPPVPSPAERDFLALGPEWGSDDGHGIRGGAVLGVRVEDDRGSVHGADHDAARRLRNGAVGYDGL